MSNETKTDTPLTDEHCGIREGDDPENFFCTVEFARNLERQLAYRDARIAELARQLDDANHLKELISIRFSGAQKDTERLDWLLAHPWTASAFPSTWSRQAIDTAMKEGE